MIHSLKSAYAHVLVLSLSLLMFACGSAEPAPAPDAAATPEKVAAIPVAVQAIEIGEATSVYATTTTLEAEARAEVLARTNGVVQKIHKEEGDLVSEGELLVSLDDADQQVALKMARIKMENLEKEFVRQKKVFEDGILSPQDYETIEGRLKEARATVEQSELNLSYTQIKAPFSGHLVRRLIDLGTHVQPTTPVFEIMDVSPLLARIHIPAVRMGKVQSGQTVQLRLESNHAELEGRLRLVSPIVDATTGTVKVTAEISSYPPGTRPGDFVQVDVVTERRSNAMLVPSVAVFEDKGQQVVFSVVDGKAVRKVVTLGFVERGTTEIISGLTGDEQIVVKGQRSLREGLPVEILESGTEGEKAKQTTEATVEAAP